MYTCHYFIGQDFVLCDCAPFGLILPDLPPASASDFLNMAVVDKALVCAVWHYFCLTCGILYIVSAALYLLPILYLSIFAPSQNLKKRYNATWALVTGGSSGIGKAVVQKLASQVRPLCRSHSVSSIVTLTDP